MTTIRATGENVHARNTAPECAGTDDPFDYQQLLDEWRENAPILGKLLETFRRESASDLADLETAIGASDATRVARLAHRIKGSAAVMGARRVREQAALLEAYGQRRELGDALACLKMLRTEIERCTDFVASLNRAG